MNRAAWRERYLAKNALSPTRKRIERLADLISAPVLKTNIWCVEAKSDKHLTPADRSTAVFEMLLEQIRPAVVVAHGSKAISLLDHLSDGAQVIAVPHLSGLESPKGFGWNDERLQQLAERVNGAITGPRGRPRNCRVTPNSGTRRIGQRLLPLNMTFRRQLAEVFPFPQDKTINRCKKTGLQFERTKHGNSGVPIETNAEHCRLDQWT